MILKHGTTDAVELDYEVFKTLLGFYPEEKLVEYRLFKGPMEKGSITISELKDASEKIHLPWQMFLLDKGNLKRELQNIEDNRLDKFPKGALEIHKRKGAGNITSKRIIDRQIRIQAFVTSLLPDDFNCDFAGSLKNKTIEQAVEHIIEYFKMDLNQFRTRDDTEKAKNYLISIIQSKNNINVAQGVLTNGILPEIKNTREIYRNTSGFVVQDKKLPFIFLPSEINPDENHYRQIYTLLYLLVVIGMDEYSHAIENYPHSVTKVRENKKFKKINNIVSEVLLPSSVTDVLDQKAIDKDAINKLKKDYKLSYSAVLYVLRTRKVIDVDLVKELELPKREPSKIKEAVETVKTFFPHPHITTSVKKFCGDVATVSINTAIRNGLYPNRGQMIVFGRSRKDKWIELRSRI
jgi:Zn-dependent peptidase ImmA (M78 family)